MDNFWLINKRFWKYLFKDEILGVLKGVRKPKFWLYFLSFLLLWYIIKGFFIETKTWVSLSIWLLLFLSYLWYKAEVGDWRLYY